MALMGWSLTEFPCQSGREEQAEPQWSVMMVALPSGQRWPHALAAVGGPDGSQNNKKTRWTCSFAGWSTCEVKHAVLSACWHGQSHYPVAVRMSVTIDFFLFPLFNTSAARLTAHAFPDPCVAGWNISTHTTTHISLRLIHTWTRIHSKNESDAWAELLIGKFHLSPTRALSALATYCFVQTNQTSWCSETCFAAHFVMYHQAHKCLCVSPCWWLYSLSLRSTTVSRRRIIICTSIAHLDLYTHLITPMGHKKANLIIILHF